MKTTTLKLTAMAFAAALFGAIGCGSGGCGGTNINDNSSSQSSTPSMQCGNGTYLDTATNQCRPRQTTAPTSTKTNYLH